MGRQIINHIECGFCHKEFDVATEDLEWEHIEDVGETDEDVTLHDYAISQKIDCPFCSKANSILVVMKGTSVAKIESMEVKSMELDTLL